MKGIHYQELIDAFGLGEPGPNVTMGEFQTIVMTTVHHPASDHRYILMVKYLEAFIQNVSKYHSPEEVQLWTALWEMREKSEMFRRYFGTLVPLMYV